MCIEHMITSFIEHLNTGRRQRRSWQLWFAITIEIEIKVKDVIVFQKFLTKEMFSNPRKDTITDLASTLQNKIGQNKLNWVSLVSLGTQVNSVRSNQCSIISSRNLLPDL